MKNITTFIYESMKDALQKIQSKLENNQDMIISGRFGRNEEQKLITLAKKNGYADAITVYADKMESEDLSPIGNAVPQWAQPILDNKNKKYLLIFAFDNIARDTMQAVMPLFLKHLVMGKSVKNMNWCIAAKNINDIPQAVLSRAGGEHDIITL